MKGGLQRVEDALLSAPRDDARRLDALIGEESTAGAPAGGTPANGSGDDARTQRVRKLMIKELPVREQVWVLMDNPHSSRAAQLIAATVMCLIITSCTAFLVQTLPEYQGSRSPVWGAIETVCMAVFVLELGLRVWSCPDRVAFFRVPLNVVDVLAVLPYFLELAMSTSGSSGSSIVRVIRLIRIFRVFKISRYLPWLRVFGNALYLSSQPLLMLMLMISLASVLFSSAIYYAERGTWDAQRGEWVRVAADGSTSTSPYQSIPESFWWTIVTMTTVGYGDVTPITAGGRFVAMLAAISGILVLAIPVSIISTNFNSEFAQMARQKEQVKARVLLLKKHFRERTTGLAAVMDEVEDIVRRNTQELKGELDAVFQAAQTELTEELQELLRMAYERRRQLHLAALSAGRVHASPDYGMASENGGAPPAVVPLEEGNEAAMRPGAHERGEAGGAAVEAAAAAAAAAELQSAMRRSARFGAVREGGGEGSATDPYAAAGEARPPSAL